MPALPDSASTVPDTQSLLAFLASHDAACPVCSHGLRGITAPICPECGSPLRLEVTSANLHLGPWSLAIASMALAMGFDGVVSLILGAGLGFSAIFQGATRGQLYPPLTIFSTIATLGVFTTLALVGFVRRRRAWRRLAVRKQWRLAALIFITVGAVHALGGAGIVAWLSRP